SAGTLCPRLRQRGIAGSARGAAYQPLRYRVSGGRVYEHASYCFRDRQPGEGSRRTGGAEYESDVRLRRNRGAAVKLLIKLGGTLLDQPESRLRLASEIGDLAARGHRIVVVHGGGKQMTRLLDAQGIQSRFVDGLRVSSPEVID